MVLGYDGLAMPRTPIAQWIVDFRRYLGLTQAHLAREIDVALGTVKAWETGRQIPRGPTMLLLRYMARLENFHEPPEITQPRKEYQDVHEGTDST